MEGNYNAIAGGVSAWGLGGMGATRKGGFGSGGALGRPPVSHTGSPYTLVAAIGSFLLTGDAMTPVVDYKLPSDLGAFALTGIAATLTYTPSSSPVTVNYTGTGTTGGLLASGTSGNYNGITIASGTHIALVVMAIFDDNGSSTSGYAATWNGNAMTLLQSQASPGGGAAVLFGLTGAGVTTGNHTLALSWTGTTDVYVDAVAFNNVDQTSAATAFPVAGRIAATGTSTTASVVIPSSTSDYCVQSTLVPSGRTATASDTKVFFSNLGNVLNAAGQYGSGTSSKTLTETLNSSGTWYSVGVDVAAG